MTERFFAPCPRGLEGPLAAELDALGAGYVTPTDGGVGFAGEIELAYRANLFYRTFRVWSRLRAELSVVLRRQGLGLLNTK